LGSCELYTIHSHVRKALDLWDEILLTLSKSWQYITMGRRFVVIICLFSRIWTYLSTYSWLMVIYLSRTWEIVVTVTKSVVCRLKGRGTTTIPSIIMWKITTENGAQIWRGTQGITLSSKDLLKIRWALYETQPMDEMIINLHGRP